jgi:hypothetical protein
MSMQQARAERTIPQIVPVQQDGYWHGVVVQHGLPLQ